MFTLGAVQDLSLKQRTLDWALKSGEVKTQDTFYPIGSVASNAVGAELVWKYFQEVRIMILLVVGECGGVCVLLFTVLRTFVMEVSALKQTQLNHKFFILCLYIMSQLFFFCTPPSNRTSP